MGKTGVGIPLTDVAALRPLPFSVHVDDNNESATR